MEQGTINQCPICGINLKEFEPPQRAHKYYFNCHFCGQYYLSENCFISLPITLKNDIHKKVLLAHIIRKMQNAQSPPFIDDLLLDQILKRTLPSPIEQADNLIIWLGENDKYLIELTEVSALYCQAVIGAVSPAAFSFILKELKGLDLITGAFSNNNSLVSTSKIRLTFKGWDHFDKLIKGAKSSKKVFMAMQYNDHELDTIVENVFKKAVEQTGFELFKLNDPEKQKAGLIDDRLRVEIRTSRIIIADLTHDNKGAYWEAGYAEGLGKPVIYTCEEAKFKVSKTHFDTNHHLTIIWNKNNHDKVIEELKATIRATLPDEAILTDT